ncbi:helix-turn-helix domain-containing protein [Methylobacterium platani]|uniref:AraC family transcriptional regulator n=1 Tax=Methylobacterium platani TaxID=427683 RepID=A0A179S0U8_9HYPH|nr:helix-turn-helix domain-containing protein [Methylobacterium platani]OAS18843.1 AraC family transcriptional regulator [Methylobacterium platani]
MQELFSSAGRSSKDGFKLWRDTLDAQLIPVEIARLDDGPFQARFEATKIGQLRLSRITQSALRSNTTSTAHRRHDKPDTVGVFLMSYGESASVQDDRESVQRSGDLLVLDWCPVVRTTLTTSQSLFVEVPRERLESSLGSPRRYTALTVGANLGSTKLASSFVQNLVRLGPQLAADSATRMASVAVDLIVASIAERLAQEVPRPLHGTVAVQRAEAYIEAHLGDRSLDPSTLAAAIGLSLRRLQELFAEHDRNISDYIWFRRLETAKKRLVDPGCAHLSIGAVAQGCGFADQAHFSRRFKALHGMTASEYRITHRVRARSDMARTNGTDPLALR